MVQQQKLLDARNKKLVRQKAESVDIKEGVAVLTDRVWKPLEVLKAKFHEFDLDHSGNIDRREFLRLCNQIEQNLRVSPLFSMLDQHSASSVFANDRPSFGHNTGTIDSTQGWSAATNHTDQWYQIDCVVAVTIGGVLVQGRYNADQWVTEFQISHSIDGVQWLRLSRNGSPHTFDGNRDRDTKETVLFDVPINARYIRFHPVSWHNHISMRADILWVEGCDDNKDDDGPNDSEFTIEEQNKLFNLFDLKKTGVIDAGEFLAVLDREAIRDPRQHPHRVIKQTMKYLLYGKVNVAEEYKLEMLGAESKGFKFAPGSRSCSVCGRDGVYGFTAHCEHSVCTECLRQSLQRTMENGEFPAYCIGCKEAESPALDKLLHGELLRFWVDEAVIDIASACRMWRAQNRVIQELQFEELMKTSGMRKCPHCGLVILKNEGCNYFKCKECATEICYETGLVAGKADGQCGGGHNCHY